MGSIRIVTKTSGAFEMSVRTLKRDIEFMKDSLKMPIEFDVLKNGYSFTGSLPHFPARTNPSIHQSPNPIIQ